MADREKLIELLYEAEEHSTDICVYNSDCKDCPGGKYGNKCRDYLKADHLIANGVTVRERGRWETTEVTEERETVERFHHFHRECKYSYCDNGLGGHYFCPNCGADMRGEEDG